MIRTCAQCGQSNRIPPRHLTHTGRCGKCKAALSPLAEPLAVNSSEFDEILREASVPVLVDFWAAWCGPCRQAAPHVQKVAQALSGRAVVLKVDTEQNPDLAQRYQVSSIPNFMVFKQGKVVFQQPGLVSAGQMQKWLEQAGA